MDKRDPLGFSGHLIIGTDNHLLDLSALQFHRPQHGIVCDGPILACREAVATVRFGNEEFARVTLPQGFVFYEAFKTNQYLKSNDWRKNSKSITGLIIRRLKPEIKTFQPSDWN